MALIEDKDFDVTLTITLGTNISFAPIERDRPITKADAVDNAIGSIPPEVFRLLEGEGFGIAYPIEGSAEELG